MIQFIPSHVGLAHDKTEPSAPNYSLREYAERVVFDAGDQFWGVVDQVFVTDGEQTFWSAIDPVEVTPGTVVTVVSDLRIGDG